MIAAADRPRMRSVARTRGADWEQKSALNSIEPLRSVWVPRMSSMQVTWRVGIRG